MLTADSHVHAINHHVFDFAGEKKRHLCMLHLMNIFFISFSLFSQDDEEVVSIALEDIVVGEEYEGVVNNVVPYGAFVDIGTEVCGLHNSYPR